MKDVSHEHGSETKAGDIHIREQRPVLRFKLECKGSFRPSLLRSMQQSNVWWWILLQRTVSGKDLTRVAADDSYFAALPIVETIGAAQIAADGMQRCF